MYIYCVLDFLVLWRGWNPCSMRNVCGWAVLIIAGEPCSNQVFLRIFICKNPLLSSQFYSLFMPAQLTALLCTSLICSDLFAVALFFQASGGGNARKSKSSDACNLEGPWEALGGMLISSTIAVAVATLPIYMMSKIRWREFLVLGLHHEEFWRRQLLAWRIKDYALIAFVIAYNAFCLFFVLLLVANTDTYHGRKILNSVFIAISEQVLCAILVQLSKL